MSKKIRFLSLEEQITQWQLWKGGSSKAGNILYESYEPLIRKHAGYFKRKNPNADYDDLYASAVEGFFKALTRFDPKHGASIGIYAGVCIRQSLREELSSIYKSRINHKTQIVVREIHKELCTAQENVPLSYIFIHVAHNLKQEPDDIRAIYEAANVKEISLHSIVVNNKTTTTIGDLIADNNALDPTEIIGQNDTSDIINRALDQLHPRLKRIIILRFGFSEALKEDGETRATVAAEMGITRERIRQLEESAVAKLRKILSETALAPQ